MRSSLFAFAYDFLDEGVDQVLDNAHELGGMDGVSVTSAYHAGRDLFPHNPRRRIRFLDPGTVFFHPDLSLYAGTPIQPRVAPEFADIDMVRTVVNAAGRRDLTVGAWTVYFHTDRDRDLIDHAPRNAFNDPYLTDICPLAPASQEYARAITRDVASTGVSTISAESLHFPPLEHGFHHERFFVQLGPETRYLLSICFCDACRGVAQGAGIDGDKVQRAVAQEIDKQIRGGSDEALSLDAVSAMAGGQLGAYLAAQRSALTTLITELVQIAGDGGAQLNVVDLSGVMKGYATGAPTGAPAAEDSWKLGLELQPIVASGAVIAVPAYVRDQDRLRLELTAYQAVVGDALSVILRPSPPDVDSQTQLAEKIRLVANYPGQQLGFYCYGLVNLDRIGWIGDGLRGLHG